MKLTLLRRKNEAPGVESFVFSPTKPISWIAGQFLHYVLHHEPTDNRGSDRWFTIASAPFEKEIRLTTRFSSDKSSSFKLALLAMKTGESIEAANLSGDFIVEDFKQEYVFIAGGIGITPFYSILKEANHDGKKFVVTLLYANRDKNIPFKKDLDVFAKNNPNLVIHYIISPKRIDEYLINKLVSSIQKSFFYISGAEKMVDNLDNTLKGMDVPTDRIKKDYFPGYKNE